MTLISNILYWISTGLLVPVIVLLIFFFIRSLIMIGGFFGQYMKEKELSAKIYSQIDGLTTKDLDSFGSELKDKPGSTFEVYVKKIIDNRENHPRVKLLLSEYELENDRNIATSRILTKMGPILGLMGTLIPMGPALVGLASGDIASMAYNMQVAFATTVVGLVASAIGFITQQLKERWAERGLSRLVYIADLTEQKNEDK